MLKVLANVVLCASAVSAAAWSYEDQAAWSGMFGPFFKSTIRQLPLLNFPELISAVDIILPLYLTLLCRSTRCLCDR
jgi:hypothetical protein